MCALVCACVCLYTGVCVLCVCMHMCVTLVLRPLWSEHTHSLCLRVSLGQHSSSILRKSQRVSQWVPWVVLDYLGAAETRTFLKWAEMHTHITYT